MINPDELMIGNLVKTQGEVHSILQLCKFVCHMNLSGDISQFIHYKYLEPIPLTEEWLLKLGAEKQEKYEWYGNGQDYTPRTNKTECVDFVFKKDFFIRFERWGYIPENSTEWIMFESIKIFDSEWYEKCCEEQICVKDFRYVHQLQNVCNVVFNIKLPVK